MIRLRGLDHLVLRARDAERLVRFYCEVLGCIEERRVADLGLVQLRAGSALIDIVPVEIELGRRGGAPPRDVGRNMDHFCLLVDPFDEQALRETLVRHGIEAGETAVRYGATGFGPSIYLTDPEGNTVELKGFTPASPQSPRSSGTS
ncbi:MAG: VOC family protein [Chromatiales bacterium]|nr:VOC family protein [Chromatiales bacterium]